MNKPIDTDATIQIKVSVWSMTAVLVGCLAFVAAGYWMTGDKGGSSRHSPEFIRFIGWAAMLFFSGCAVLALKALFTVDPLITLSPAGICDTRVAAEVIPWTAIQTISMLKQNRQTSMVLQLKPGEMGKLSLTRLARASTGPNRALGINGPVIGAAGTTASHAELVTATTAYFSRYGAVGT